VDVDKKFKDQPGLRADFRLKPQKSAVHHQPNWTAGALIAESTVYYDTAERLTLRGLLPPTHPLYPPSLALTGDDGDGEGQQKSKRVKREE
jgi:hypothetical protein